MALASSVKPVLLVTQYLNKQYCIKYEWQAHKDSVYKKIETTWLQLYVFTVENLLTKRKLSR